MPLLLAALALIAAGPRLDGPQPDGPRPDGLPTPPDAIVSVLTHGVGVQAYTCGAGAGGYAWRLTGPEAVLTDVSGERIGRHYAGPSWQANDGGIVTGAVAVKAPSPTGDGVDWLLLRATSAPATGLFAQVSWVERLKTSGGRPPAGGCDAAHAGAQARVPYSAEYDFYTPAKP